MVQSLLVPQYYTQNGKWPDIVLEKFIRRPGRVRDNLFVPRVFVEIKTDVNSRDAIEQLIEAITKEYGPSFNSKGFLIGVKGTQWTIMDYHIVLVQGNNTPQCFILNFYDEKGGETVQPERPTPSRQIRDLDFMDLQSPNDTGDLFKALDWIGKENEPKSLTFMKHHARSIPVSLTVSTMQSLTIKEVVELKWFLGLHVVRNRTKRTVWLLATQQELANTGEIQSKHKL